MADAASNLESPRIQFHSSSMLPVRCRTTSGAKEDVVCLRPHLKAWLADRVGKDQQSIAVYGLEAVCAGDGT